MATFTIEENASDPVSRIVGKRDDVVYVNFTEHTIGKYQDEYDTAARTEFRSKLLTHIASQFSVSIDDEMENGVDAILDAIVNLDL